MIKIKQKSGSSKTSLVLVILLGISLLVPFAFPSTVFAGPCPTNYVFRNGSCWLNDLNTTASQSTGCQSGIGTPENFKEVVCQIGGLINIMLPIVVALTMLIFFWGLVGMIRGSGDEAKVEEGKKLMVWGVVALFVMVSFVGILNLFYGDFFGGVIGVPQLPQ
jgi:hypothetical protein